MHVYYDKTVENHRVFLTQFEPLLNDFQRLNKRPFYWTAADDTQGRGWVGLVYQGGPPWFSIQEDELHELTADRLRTEMQDSEHSGRYPLGSPFPILGYRSA